jgi:hypothetical protein
MVSPQRKSRQKPPRVTETLETGKTSRRRAYRQKSKQQLKERRRV